MVDPREQVRLQVQGQQCVVLRGQQRVVVQQCVAVQCSHVEGGGSADLGVAGCRAHAVGCVRH
jgi:hypothetical protein